MSREVVGKLHHAVKGADAVAHAGHIDDQRHTRRCHRTHGLSDKQAGFKIGQREQGRAILIQGVEAAIIAQAQPVASGELFDVAAFEGALGGEDIDANLDIDISAKTVELGCVVQRCKPRRHTGRKRDHRIGHTLHSAREAHEIGLTNRTLAIHKLQRRAEPMARTRTIGTDREPQILRIIETKPAHRPGQPGKLAGLCPPHALHVQRLDRLKADHAVGARVDEFGHLGHRALERGFAYRACAAAGTAAIECVRRTHARLPPLLALGGVLWPARARLKQHVAVFRLEGLFRLVAVLALLPLVVANDQHHDAKSGGNEGDL